MMIQDGIATGEIKVLLGRHNNDAVWANSFGIAAKGVSGSLCKDFAWISIEINGCRRCG